MEPRNNKDMALACADVYHRALSWVVGFAASGAKGREEAEGFLLTGEEAEILQIPAREIYERIADGMRVTPGTRFTMRELVFWNNGTCRVATRDAEGRIQQSYPGERPASGGVEQIEFMPKPMYLPFCDIIRGLEYAAAVLGLKPRSLHFRWRRLLIHSGETFFQAITLGGVNPRQVMAAVEKWREEADARIKGALDPTLPAETRNAPPAPDKVRGVAWPRRKLLEYLNKTKRTLQRWDRQGYAADGLPWVKGRRDSAGTLVYDMEKLWPTLTVLTGRRGECLEVIERAKALERENQAFLEEKYAESSEAC